MRVGGGERRVPRADEYGRRGRGAVEEARRRSDRNMAHRSGEHRRGGESAGEQAAVDSSRARMAAVREAGSAGHGRLHALASA